jgi:hypothetical protein
MMLKGLWTLQFVKNQETVRMNIRVMLMSHPKESLALVKMEEENKVPI